MSPDDPVSSGDAVSFREPTRSIDLRWGSYETRYAAGITFIVTGLICLQGTSGSVASPMLLGTVAHLIGWWLLPARGRRRIWISIASLAVSWILLIGPAGAGLLAVPFAGWLFVRQRPALSYLSVLPVFATGLVIRSITGEESAMIPALAVMAVVIVGSAWVARGVAVLRGRRAGVNAPGSPRRAAE